MPTRHGAPLYSTDAIGGNCFPLRAGLFGPACLSTGRVSREMGDGHFGGRKSPRKVVGFVGGVGREDGLDVFGFGFGEDVYVIAALIYLFVCFCYCVFGQVLSSFECKRAS